MGMRLLKLPIATAKLLEFLWKLMDGKKTLAGALVLAAWFLMYLAPLLFPQHPELVALGFVLRDFLSSLGFGSDEILISGGGLTVIGLLDKVRKLIEGAKNNDPGQYPPPPAP